MEISIGKKDLYEYVKKQLDFFYPDKYVFEGTDVKVAFDLALERLENCFKFITFPAYCNQKGQTFFSHLHSDQYAQFLYFLSNSLWTGFENRIICDKLINLNKTLNGFFFSYKGKLPDVFFFGHPDSRIRDRNRHPVFLRHDCGGAVHDPESLLNDLVDGNGIEFLRVRV